MQKNNKDPENFEAIELDILGMSCVNCANSIKTYLTKVDGVYSVDVNFASEVAEIEYNPNLITKDSIIQDIKRMGYDVMVEDDEDKIEKQKQKQLLLHKYKIYTSLSLSLIVMAITMSNHSD